MLAIFGDKDRQMDPLRGAHAYQKALGKAGNPKSRVEIFPSANHSIVKSENGCPDEDAQWFEQYVKTLGYGSVSEARAAILKDPYKPGIASAFPYVPGTWTRRRNGSEVYRAPAEGWCHQGSG